MCYLAETLRLIHAGAVDENRVEEDRVALLHLQVHPGVPGVVASHAVVHLIHAALKDRLDAQTAARPHAVRVRVCRRTYLPVGVVVLLQRAAVRSRQDHQAAVPPVHCLHRRPRANHAVGRPEWEVMQILMHGMTGRLLA